MVLITHISECYPAQNHIHFLSDYILWLGNIGTNFQDQIVDDVEVFLPEGAESTTSFTEVREEWSTDVLSLHQNT